MLLLITIINNVFAVYKLMLFASIISSWFPDFRSTKIMQFILFYTEPYFNLFRRFIPPLGMIDISPIIAFFALQLIQGMLIKFLIMLFIS